MQVTLTDGETKPFQPVNQTYMFKFVIILFIKINVYYWYRVIVSCNEFEV